MRPYPDELIQGMRWSLQNVIVPELTSDWAKSVAGSLNRLLAIVEVRWQKEAAYLIQDTQEMGELFRTLSKAFREAPLSGQAALGALAKEMQQTLTTAHRAEGEYPSVPVLTGENAAYRQTLCNVIEGMKDAAKNGASKETLDGLRHQVRLFLRRQTDRDSELAQATFGRPVQPPPPQPTARATAGQ
ncbi:MAG: hypothetical protein HY677_04690 [Chloroflexi bacterium]|nr:hypothetical protein [Chloroflexota bacterium]